MRKKEELPEGAHGRILELLMYNNGEINLNKIHEDLIEKNLYENSYITLGKRMNDTLHLVWSKEKHCWKSTKGELPPFVEQVAASGIKEEPTEKTNTEKIENLGNLDNKDDPAVEDPSLLQYSNEQQETISPANIEEKPEVSVPDLPQDLKEMKENIEAILNKFEKLEKSISKIKESINDMRTESQSTSISADYEQLMKEFVNIYASKKEKDSVSINLELKNRVMQHLEDTYKIKGNASLAVDIALLLALYDGRK